MKFDGKLSKNSKMQNDFSQSIGIEKINENEIPKSWELVKFQEIIELKHGHQFRNYDFVEKGIPVIKIGQCKDDGTLELSNCDFIDNDRIDEFSEFIINKGDLLMALTGGTIGKVTFVNKDYGILVQNYRVGKFVPNENYCIKEFATLILKSSYFQNLIKNNVNQSAQPNIGKEQINQFLLPLPPLAEQQLIVACVEALLMHVNATRDRLSRVPLIMKKFRQAVLATACSGSLTEGWREENPDVESGSQLLERLNESRKKIKKIGKTFEDDTFFEQLPELPSTWTWSTIQQTAERVTVGHVGPMKNEYRSGGIPFLRCQNVRENYFDAHGLVYISPQFHESLKKSALEPGDLVVVRSGNVGVCCIIPESLTEANCSDLVIVKKPFGFVPKFGAYYVNSLAQKWIDSGTVGIALSHFNTKSVAILPIPIPPLAEQHEIVRSVNALFERADAIEHEMVVASRRCERLTQAVLGKAFRGELVPVEMTEVKA